MINRETKTVTYRAFNEIKDAYGQPKREVVDSDVEMMIKIMGQHNVEDPRFVDCDAIGITKQPYLSFSLGDYIIDGSTTYLIKYLIPSNRFQQVLLKCEK